jgi:pimeloyl-ACP methyl ester carboxylesterase
MITPLIEMHRAGNSGRAVHRWMRSVSGSHWREELEHLLPGVGQQADDDAAGTFEYDLTAMRQWDFDAAGAERIEQPVLYLVSSGSAAGNEAAFNMFRAKVPHVRRVVIPDADHNLQMTNPVLVAKTIAEFVRRHPMETPDDPR